MSDDRKNREEVHDILLAQIESRFRVKADATPNLTFDNQVICSSQTYYSGLDGDMSDLAVGFYEILYSDILSDRILDGKYLKSKCFAGDTMNTGITHTRPKTKLEEKYRHSLANFWLIPMYYGRKSSKVIQSIETNDYMDRALDVIEKEWSNLQNNIEYKPYFCKFKNFDDFRRFQSFIYQRE